MNTIDKKSLYNFVIELKHKDRSSPEFKKLLSIFIRDITERNQKYKCCSQNIIHNYFGSSSVSRILRKVASGTSFGFCGEISSIPSDGLVFLWVGAFSGATC